MSTQEGSTAPYDMNFVLPVRIVENARVRLEPFIPAVHAEEHFAGSKDHPELYTYLANGPFDSVEELLEKFVIGRVHNDPTSVLFAIIDKTGIEGKPRVAGIVGLLNTSVSNLSTDFGIVVLPAFQSSHVAPNAIGLLLHYCFELPADSSDAADSSPFGSDSGLGLRRVQWQAHIDNAKSVRMAERMGFRREGIARWQRLLTEGKRGHEVPRTRGVGGTGSHTCVLALCWDDWELEGAKDAVRIQMER